MFGRSTDLCPHLPPILHRRLREHTPVSTSTTLPMRVTPGQTYDLAAWVKEAAGAGDHKVTVNWCGPAGHIKYDNDWAGANRPAAYTLHGGRFVAPAGADSATIILGVRDDSRCLFDDVSLTPVR